MVTIKTFKLQYMLCVCDFFMIMILKRWQTQINLLCYAKNLH